MNSQTNYRNQRRLDIKKAFAIIMGSLIVLLLVLITTISSINAMSNKNNEKQQAIMSGKFNSIQDILEYYGCRYIRTKENQTEGFAVDIYTEFQYDLYNEQTSNEKFYNDVINKIAEFIYYKNFRMIDTSKEEKIEIEVICDGAKIETIYINGIEDYFIYMDSKISLSQYKELKTTEISVQATELLNCIQNNWNTNIEFGTRESIFQNYYIYFDEGIKTRKINGKIDNIVFTEKYLQPVINGFTVGTKNDIIISKLGKPTFQNDDQSIIGYKSNDIYVFFEKDQISIYRNTQEEGFNEFFELVDKFLEEEYSLLEFMNELTYLWPDYDEYTYAEDTVFLSYPHKGIDIKINYDNMDGIILYNNIGVKQKIVNQYLEHTEFVAQLQVDNVFNSEKRRFEREKSLSTKCKEYQEEYEKENDHNRGNVYDYYMKMTEDEQILKVYFISTNPEYTNYELNEAIDSYIWLNEYCFIYSIKKNGIYYYDLKKQIKGTIIKGEENFDIKSCENGVLKYDNKTLLIQE